MLDLLLPANIGLTADKSLCAQEPIHIPGSIQPHGALVVLDLNNDLTIVAVSDNIACFLPGGLPAAHAILGTKLDNLLGQGFLADLQALLITEEFQSGITAEITIDAAGGCGFACAANLARRDRLDPKNQVSR